MKKLILFIIGLSLVIAGTVIEAHMPDIKLVENMCIVQPANHIVLMLLGINLIFLSALSKNKKVRLINK